MTRYVFITIILFAGIFFSCKKISVSQNHGDAEWVKVITDASVFFPGKMRADAQNNLYCSYNYTDYEIDSNSAVIKLDSKGNILWRRSFADTTIYDFVVTPEGKIVIPIYSNGMITLIELDPAGNIISSGNPYVLPFNAADIDEIVTLKIFIEADVGYYNLSGTILYNLNFPNERVGFMMEFDNNFNGGWKRPYFFANPRTVITGCAETDDGYLLFGNIQFKNTNTSEVFTLKTDAGGNKIGAIKEYSTSAFNAANDPPYSGFYCNTSDIIRAGNKFYACAYNELYNVPTISSPPVYADDDNSARIYTFDSDGNKMGDPKTLKYDIQNLVADLVLTKDSGLLIGLNPVTLVGIGYVGRQSSYVARLNSDLSIQSVSNIQTNYKDYLGSICAMPDGTYAIETMIQSFGEEHYRLEVIKTDVNGNF
ncbi:MAG TPA: hypothetical protein VE978_18915 [Chitinophagales bacterium]|nr:hypothetical protein [Chitinophagales bacterium]